MFSSFGIMKNAANTLISQHNSMYIGIQHLSHWNHLGLPSEGNAESSGNFAS